MPQAQAKSVPLQDCGSSLDRSLGECAPPAHGDANHVQTAPVPRKPPMTRFDEFLNSHRKFRKLFRSPEQFFGDMLGNRLAGRQRARACYRYSVVTAVHDAEATLDAYFASLTQQSVDFTSALDVILIDDGSSDGSVALIERWMARFPENIRLVRQAHLGPGAARNAGIPLANGEWITFIDADDTVEPGYFAAVDRFLGTHQDKGLSLVVCQMLAVDAANQPVLPHVLQCNFTAGNRVLSPRAADGLVHTSVASAFFERTRLLANGVRFEERLGAAFEDGHFVSRYRLLSFDASIGVCAAARYLFHCSPRAELASAKAWAERERFAAVFEYGYEPLVEEARERTGGCPAWLELTLLYEMYGYHRWLLDHDERIALLSEGERAAALDHIHRVFEAISVKTIIDFKLGGVGAMHRQGWLWHHKNAAHEPIVYATDWDPPRRMIQLRYFYAGERPLEEFTLAGKDVVPVYAKDRHRKMLGSCFVVERFVWLPFSHESAALTCSIDGVAAKLATRTKRHGTSMRLGAMLADLKKGRSGAFGPPGQQRPAEIGPMARRFRDAWVFADRDIRADDNAEALYRYVRRARPDINAFFVLNRSSPDWRRLKREGFRLLRFGSLAHKLALANARFLISSHANLYIHDVPPRLRRKSGGYQFVFLQHGVIKADLSHWLNNRDMACFVVSTEDEYQSIAGDGNNYKFSPREIACTGLPRHDDLLRNNVVKERLIAIIPTWRDYAVGRFTGAGTERSINAEFGETPYARHWKALIHSPELKRLADEAGYKILFAPHANTLPYLDWFEVPDHVEVVTFQNGERMRDLFCRLSVLVTDFSSVDCETSLLDRAVVYYHFDFDEVLSGKHSYCMGYFDWRRDGFGPCCADESAVLEALRGILARDGAPEPQYLDRMRRTMSLRDGQNCRRTLDWILSLESPEIASPQAPTLLVEAARSASKAGKWTLAEARYSRVASLERADIPEDFELRWATAKRHCGDFAAARELLSRIREPFVDDAALHWERAELATASRQWPEARQCWQRLWNESSACDPSDATRTVTGCRLAEAARQLGDFRAAEAVLAELAEPTMLGDVLWERAEIASAIGDAKLASRAWSAVLACELEPERRREAVLRAAQSEAARGALQTALFRLDDYLRTVKSPGAELPARLYRIELWVAAKQSDQASSEAQRLLPSVRKQGDASDRVRLAAVMRHCGLLEAAVGLLDCDFGPELGAAYQAERAALLLARQDYTGVLRATAVAEPSATAEPWQRSKLARLTALRKLELLDEAEELATELAAVTEPPADLLYERAELAHARHDWREASSNWQTLRRTYPEFRPALVAARTVFALERCGQVAEAREVLRGRAVELAVERLEQEPTDVSLLAAMLVRGACEGEGGGTASANAEPVATLTRIVRSRAAG
jgi:glycosyltransferase involved in cell wall biosynthesis/CDP-glycerol glycerophosphotransferase (TagB/SpsB family)/tetratricopeptide (TPR) repeat protein